MPLTIYKSSAGSGKTYTLVQEYVKLLVKEPREFRNILAITFTNKATDEMKERIISALSKMIGGEFNDLEDYIIADLKLLGSGHGKLDTLEKARKHVRTQASTALNNILHNYSEFSVSTIDSFFQQILRSFTKELKLPQRYEVEMRTGYVMDQITAKLLTEIGHTLALTDWLTDYAYSQLEDDKGWNIERSIKDLGVFEF